FGLQITGSGNLVQDGSGVLTLTAASTYGGATSINAGAIALGIDDALTTTTHLRLGVGASAGRPDATNFSQTVSGLSFRSTDAAAENTVEIGAGQTLLVNGTGSLKMGTPSPFANGQTTNAVISGAGTLHVNNAGGIMQVGTRNVDQNQPQNEATLDLT